MNNKGRYNSIVFIVWILTLVATGCPPPDDFHPCTCGDTTINCDNVTSTEELIESFNYDQFDKVFDNILINHTPIDTLPGGMLAYVKTKTFRITNNHNLFLVSDDAFQGSEDTCESLILINNSIAVDLVFDAISTLNKLEYINLERNKLQMIPDDAFVKVKNLKTALLSYNQITSIGKRAFANLTHLEKVDLRHNKISSIGEYCFFNLPQVKDIKLFFNRLENVGDHAFALGPSTNHHDSQSTVIWLNRNELTGFWPKAFEGLGRNALIHMFRNRITTLPENLYVSVLDHFHSLNSNEFFSKGFLDFGGNNLTCDCKVKWLVEKPKYLKYAIALACVETGKDLITYELSYFKDCDSS